ncbi:response regulator [candidate division KSB1 bacterium]|nr:response regulator [candidate division KSB1 bacterium]
MKYNILIVDDEAAQRDTLAGFLRKKGYEISTAMNGLAAIKITENNPVDMILTDLRMPDLDGLGVLKRVKEINPDIDVVVMTAYGSIEAATEAMKQGAVDFVAKPIDLTQLELVMRKALERKQLIAENRRLKELAGERLNLGGIIASSSAMDEALSIASRVARSKATILIAGESGTGKELVAKAIHHASDRSEDPFVPVNMAALSDHLVESELFGHEKGAFTGADKFRKGRFESASGGTLFIDEVGDVPLNTQVKLLRVLQEQTIERVGSSQSLSIDVRVIAATNRHLEEMVKQGSFREDFYYRLNVVKIVLPPLRKRKTDIPLLVDYFLQRFSEQYEKNIHGVSREAMDLLMKYTFPGNVRELENIVERAVLLSRDDVLASHDLPPTVHGESPQKAFTEPTNGSFQERVEAFEQALIRDALQAANGVQTRAAEILGMTERHLRYKLKKYGK